MRTGPRNLSASYEPGLPGVALLIDRQQKFALISFAKAVSIIIVFNHQVASPQSLHSKLIA
ncbi:hypothetical protein PCANC_27742 [Puccinia coronata f. sp. avenae]|uniref:Uncharacterized protein n=1 Tax=Puccinia coronata f. sp. avenae TaxID=200324 RepID=A0A2N5TJC4_9BASI|nr:hypothetical protein PCANC_27742 [Puccinia coronata f. sp. avenae]PLW30293.1 hypothetical protein PCASD_19993 [Puccinia coronata f. sp. avenae]